MRNIRFGDILLVYLILSSSTALHESAHTALFKYFGVDVIEIKVGISEIFSFKPPYGIAEKVSLGVIPVAGETKAYKDQVNKLNLYNVALILLAGPMMNIAVIAILLWAYFPGRIRSFIVYIPLALSLGNVVENLLPDPINDGGRAFACLMQLMGFTDNHEVFYRELGYAGTLLLPCAVSLGFMVSLSAIYVFRGTKN